MPWEICNQMKSRESFIIDHRRDNLCVFELSRRHGISCKTGYLGIVQTGCLVCWIVIVRRRSDLPQFGQALGCGGLKRLLLLEALRCHQSKKSLKRKEDITVLKLLKKCNPCLWTVHSEGILSVYRSRGCRSSTANLRY